MTKAWHKINWSGSIATLLWLIIVIYTFKYALIEKKEHFYEIWELGSLMSVLVFGAIFLFVSYADNIKRDPQTILVYLGLFFYTFILLLLSYTILLFGKLILNWKYIDPIEHLLVELKENSFQQFIQLLACIIFTIIDLLLIYSLQRSLNNKPTNKIVREEIHIELTQLKNTVMRVDLPSIIALSTLLYFYRSTEYHINYENCPKLPEFIGGAEAFALLSFNLIYIGIIFDAKYKYFLNKINIKFS